MSLPYTGANIYPAELPPIPNHPFIFLGGTCGGNDWRHDLRAAIRYKLAGSDLLVDGVVSPDAPNHVPATHSLDPANAVSKSGAFDWHEAATYDPRVRDWTLEVVRREEEVKRLATGLLFYLGDPNDTRSSASMYSGAEAMLYAMKRPHDTAVFLDISSPWSQKHSDKQRMYFANLLHEHGPDATIVYNTGEAAQWAARKLLSTM